MSASFPMPEPPTLGDEFLAPGQNSEHHTGFVNCKTNAFGLQAKFFRTPDADVACLWTNTRRGFDGYPGLIHGGISSALLDELMANAVLIATKSFGITLRSLVQWLKPIRTGEVVTGAARVGKRSKNSLRVRAYLFRADRKVATVGVGQFYLPTEAEFRKITGLADVPPELRSAFRQ